MVSSTIFCSCLRAFKLAGAVTAAGQAFPFIPAQGRLIGWRAAWFAARRHASRYAPGSCGGSAVDA